MNIFKSILGYKNGRVSQFSNFFVNASSREKKKVIERVIRESSREQEDLLERHKRAFSN